MINLFTDMFISMKTAELHCAVQPLDFVRILGTFNHSWSRVNLYIFVSVIISNQKIKGNLKVSLKKKWSPKLTEV